MPGRSLGFKENGMRKLLCAGLFVGVFGLLGTASAAPTLPATSTDAAGMTLQVRDHHHHHHGRRHRHGHRHHHRHRHVHHRHCRTVCHGRWHRGHCHGRLVRRCHIH
jgi:Ni/Co efflux regulator RcnB